MLLEHFYDAQAIVLEGDDDWKSRFNVAFDRGDTIVSVNDLERCTYVAVMQNGKPVGKLTTRGTVKLGGKSYTLIGLAELDRKVRGQGIGLLMYRALLGHIQTDGLASYLPDRSNKRQVPAIYRRLGGFIAEPEVDYAIIPKS